MFFIIPSHGLLFWGIAVLLAFVYALAAVVGVHALTKEKISATNLIKISNIEKLISSAAIFPIVFLLIDNQVMIRFSKMDKNLYWFGIVLILIPLVWAFIVILKNKSLNTTGDNPSSPIKRWIYVCLYILVAVIVFWFFYKNIQIPHIQVFFSSFFVKRAIRSDTLVGPHFFIRILLAALVIFVFAVSIHLFIEQKELNKSKNVIDTWTSVINWCINVFIVPLMISALDTKSDYKISLPYFYDMITDIIFLIFTLLLLKFIHKDKTKKKKTDISKLNLVLTIILEVITIGGITCLFGGKQLCYLLTSICYLKKY